MSPLWEHGEARFFVTETGSFGIAKNGLRAGDAVCVFAGGKVLFLLREYRDGHRLIGCAYVHGQMDGEAANLLDDPSTSRKFKIF